MPGGELLQDWTYWTVQSVPGAQTGGYIELHKSFAFATIKAGGHEAPGFQPLASFELINAFLANDWSKIASRTPMKSLTASQPLAKKLTQSSLLREKMRSNKKTRADL